MTCSFDAMGTRVSVTVAGADPEGEAELARRAALLFARIERRFSRFRAGSELGRLNRGGARFRASASMVRVLTSARRHVERTAGLFDPTIHDALCAAGYDAPFAPGALDREAPAAAPLGRPSFLDVTLEDGAVTLPPGVRLDLGGLVKGWSADRALEVLPATSAVDAGGDIALSPGGPSGDGWVVDVEDPSDPARTLLTLRVRGGGVATSAVNRRRWRAAGEPQHHLIDPRTSRPARTDLAQVTVLAPTCEDAEVLAKAAFVLGSREGGLLIERAATGGVLVREDGRVLLRGDLEVIDDA